MADYTIEDVFEEVYRREFAEFDDLESLPDPHPSLRHKIRMNRIFKCFRKNTAKLYAVHIHFSKRTVLAFLMIILLATISACAAIKIIGDFLFEVHEDNTQLFAADIEGAPTTIEYVYELTEIPDGFELTNELTAPSQYIITYSNEKTGATISMRQSTKQQYDGHYNTEGYCFETIKLNNHDALYIEYGISDCVMVWDNDDYILHISCNLTKDEVIRLTENIKIKQN